ncbi:MAG TPA: hypothetical protein VJB94_00535 [Candidatus Nanoarchaeia archaeon]|nr:hypothetical protein [Candidatus Nanoarchaeia archaeon]
MQTFLNLIEEANKAFLTADHLAFVTYPIVNDNKMFILIVENLFKAASKGMEAIIYYDRLYKRISPINNDFGSHLQVFKDKCMPRYGIDRSNFLLIQDLKMLIDERKKAPMEFSRREHYVIADHDFRIKTINLNKVKNYINQTKMFIDKLNSIKNRVTGKIS